MNGSRGWDGVYGCELGVDLCVVVRCGFVEGRLNNNNNKSFI